MSAHTKGPWAWFGNEYGFYLATTHSGRRFVMDFVRMGMRGAQPRFQVDSRMVDSRDLVRFEVDRTVQGLTAGKAAESVYRYDIADIDHPDARLIAQAWTIPELRAALVMASAHVPEMVFNKIRAALALANEEEPDIGRQKCQECDGKGYISPVPGYQSGCTNCNGTGQIVPGALANEETE